MTKRIDKFLVSTGASDEEYGLYVMEKESPHHTKDGLLAYSFDSDHFFHLREPGKDLFISVSDLKSCKDEFGNEYRGTRLLARIRDAIKAYTEELPGYVDLVLNSPLNDDEDKNLL